jgi:hypothetical protein
MSGALGYADPVRLTLLGRFGRRPPSGYARIGIRTPVSIHGVTPQSGEIFQVPDYL